LQTAGNKEEIKKSAPKKAAARMINAEN